jgi:hypothetical protein
MNERIWEWESTSNPSRDPISKNKKSKVLASRVYRTHTLWPLGVCLQPEIPCSISRTEILMTTSDEDMPASKINWDAREWAQEKGFDLLKFMEEVVATGCFPDGQKLSEAQRRSVERDLRNYKAPDPPED